MTRSEIDLLYCKFIHMSREKSANLGATPGLPKGGSSGRGKVGFGAFAAPFDPAFRGTQDRLNPRCCCLFVMGTRGERYESCPIAGNGCHAAMESPDESLSGGNSISYLTFDVWTSIVSCHERN